ncbi:hypothetical protein RKD38_000375 [Streptomyces ambofaciens]
MPDTSVSASFGARSARVRLSASATTSPVTLRPVTARLPAARTYQSLG